MTTVEKRVDRLELVLEEFIINVGKEYNRLYNSQMHTEKELREFKDEMKAFKDEMGDFKDEMRTQTKNMNVRWGEIANKLGTVVEDFVAPSIPRIIKETFDLDIEFFGIRIKRKIKNGWVKEYDAIATAGDYVFLNSTKSTIVSSDIKQFIEEIKKFREFFPEYKKKKIIGMMASLSVSKSVIKYADRAGILVLGAGDNLMEIKNTKGFKPKEW